MKLSEEKEELLQELLLLKAYISMQYDKADEVMESLRELNVTDEELIDYNVLDMQWKKNA